MDSTRGVIAAIFSIILAMPLLADDLRWSVVQRQIDHEFPRVPKINTGELATLLADPSAKKPMLIDVRTKAEFEVSHLAGARRVEPQSRVGDANVPAEKSTPIVTYCAVGYRSAAFAENLRRAGYTNVRNLEGSIFRWANEDRPLVHDSKPAQTVHPYDTFWGGLLKKERRAQVASLK